MNLQQIFLDELGHIRSGWRIVLFLAVLFAISGIVFFIAGTAGADLTVYAPVLLLISIFLASVLMLRLFEKRPVHSIGLPAHRRLPLEVAQGFGIGFLMITGIFLFQYGLGWITIEDRMLSGSETASIVLGALVIFGVAGLSEELLFRGYPFQVLVESINPLRAIILMSVLFSSAHIANPNVSFLSLFNIFLAGIWLSVAYLKTRTLWFPAGLHISWNFFQNTVYSFPVSGNRFEERTLFILNQSGPDLLTGGEFGPEGGLLATVTLLAAAILIHKSRFIRIGEGVWTVDRYLREELEKLQS